MYRADTIVACATAAGRGAIAVVRLSGCDAFAVADRIVRLDAGKAVRAWRLQRGVAHDAGGHDIDEVLTVRMPGPRSYTGEDVVEVHCHGSPFIVERLVSAANRAGARLAARGEFTRRAVLNGRMDLVQAEAVADLIDARGTGGAALAWAQLQGALSRRLAELRAQLLSVLADVEANVDFTDDDLPAENVEPRLRALSGADAAMAAMLAGFPAARRWREGHRVVFAGRPNVGKSSLVNALLGYGRMIVSDEPGTTRDSVEEFVDLGGRQFVLIDTAGVRETPGLAETQAVARARELAASADILVQVLDASMPLRDEDRAVLAGGTGRARIVCLNKIDLPRALRADVVRPLAGDGARVVEVAALTGEGCDALCRALEHMAEAAPESEPVAISRVRHRTALENARVAVAAAAELSRSAGAPELVSIELRTALGELASITDPVDNDDVLDAIFREFCIGK
jgi:tRNA modification GTPase